MATHLLVSENQLSLVGPLHSRFQEEAVLKTFGIIADVLELPGLPLGFVADYQIFDDSRMQIVSPSSFLNKAIDIAQTLKSDIEQERLSLNTKSVSKKSKKTSKLLEENNDSSLTMEEDFESVLQLKIDTLYRIKETFISVGLYD